MPDSHEVTRILHALGAGEAEAPDRLLSMVYDELRRVARGKLRSEGADQTLETTALVHQAYVRLFGSNDATWENRRHFFGAAAQAMRRILIERGRKAQRREARGHKRKLVALDEIMGNPEGRCDAVLALDGALTRLQRADQRKFDVVMLRYFAGLSVEETALQLGVSEGTVKGDWSFARSWLYREIERDIGNS